MLMQIASCLDQKAHESARRIVTAVHKSAWGVVVVGVRQVSPAHESAAC